LLRCTGLCSETKKNKKDRWYSFLKFHGPKVCTDAMRNSRSR
jgi:hypothetical protein